MTIIWNESMVYPLMEVEPPGSGRTQKDCRDLVRKHLFKFTMCGASCTFEVGGVVLHTIVEGSDAEFSHYLSYPFKSEHWWNTINWLEVQAHQAWIETFMEEDEVYVDAETHDIWDEDSIQGHCWGPCPRCGMGMDPESPSGHVDPTAAPCFDEIYPGVV